MEYRVSLMPRAQRDLAGIYVRISARSSNAARAWYLGLKEAVRSLSLLPARCPVTPEAKDLRQLLYGNKPHLYRIIYRVLEHEKLVEVLHVRHGKRDEFDPGQI